MIGELLHRPWPWYVTGPLLGLVAVGLLLLGNKPFGISSNLRHLCAACLPGDVAYARKVPTGASTWLSPLPVPMPFCIKRSEIRPLEIEEESKTYAKMLVSRKNLSLIHFVSSIGTAGSNSTTKSLH